MSDNGPCNCDQALALEEKVLIMSHEIDQAHERGYRAGIEAAAKVVTGSHPHGVINPGDKTRELILGGINALLDRIKPDAGTDGDST